MRLLLVVYFILVTLTLNAQSFSSLQGNFLNDIKPSLDLNDSLKVSLSGLIKSYSQISGSIENESINSVLYNNLFSSNLYTKRNSFSLAKKDKKLNFCISPIQALIRYNSDRPFGYNDGSMIPSRGVQLFHTFGVAVNSKFLKFEFNPELILAGNKEFQGFSSNYDDYTYLQYNYFMNRIDNPIRFGTSDYKRIYPGQSSFYFDYKKYRVGASTENLWWGPSQKNSIILSNNAPGFLHATIKNHTPINFFGKVEFQVLSGLLSRSNYSNTGYQIRSRRRLFEFDRYINGLTLNYQPKLIPGLYIGGSRIFIRYITELSKSFFYGWMPALSGFFSNNEYRNVSASVKSDQVVSLFLKQKFNHENAEVYLEFAKNDYALNLRDFVMEPEHASAVSFGFSKKVNLNNSSKIRFLVEYTSLASPMTSLIRQQEGWYLHYQIREGYTNFGEVLGAGIGSGSTSKLILIDYGVKNIRYGFQFEENQHNRDIYNYIFSNRGVSNWVDFSFLFFGNIFQKKYSLTYNVGVVQTKNYHWNDNANQNFVSPQIGLTGQKPNIIFCINYIKSF